MLRLQQNGLGPAGINALAAGIAEGGGASLDEVDVSCNGKLGDRALAGFVRALGLHCGVLRAVALANTGAGDLTAGELGGSFRRHAKLELVDVTPSTVVGFRSLDEVIAMMIVFNITVFIIFVVMVVYQTITSRTWGNFRLVSNRQAPELTLANKMWYHLFLSHVRCSSGTSLGHPPSPPPPPL